MTFGEAIEALKQGKKVARAGWNGRGMFLWLQRPTWVLNNDFNAIRKEDEEGAISALTQDPIFRQVCLDNDGAIFALGTICMFTHDSTGRKAVLTGWLASQSDMLLEDWQIVE